MVNERCLRCLTTRAPLTLSQSAQTAFKDAAAERCGDADRLRHRSHLVDDIAHALKLLLHVSTLDQRLLGLLLTSDYLDVLLTTNWRLTRVHCTQRLGCGQHLLAFALMHFGLEIEGLNVASTHLDALLTTNWRLTRVHFTQKTYVEALMTSSRKLKID